MANDAFRPVAYLNRACPFCFKFMLFLGEGGLADRFDFNIFASDTPEHGRIRAELEPHLDTVTFPTVQIAPGEYLRGADALIAYYGPLATRPADDMPILAYYMDGLFPAMGQLFHENRSLKAEQGRQA